MTEKDLQLLEVLLAKYIAVNEKQFPLTTCKARDVLHYVQDDLETIANDKKDKSKKAAKANRSRKAKC